MTFLTPEQGSAAIGIIQSIFAIVLLPTLLDPRAQVPRRTSIITALGLYCIAGIYIGLGPLWVATCTVIVAAIMWTLVAIYRPVRSISTERVLRNQWEDEP